MLHQVFDMSDATPIEMIEAQIIMGLESCKPIHEIAADIAKTLNGQAQAVKQLSEA